ncbi:hypothetical protein GCM10008014_09090 [Paenibacillus silvae]|uniref:Transglutaminase domain-containing protein n=1 Tax=Paenibacillus silvae TaxID=1325358 RepID=A0ABQ1Z1P2_9BACL|nr:hypothetical protein [Paenibacillus silvae]GGH46430.1 hypothetical protein GCM10008014_09090 [Paenibacillus silvae]
MSEHKNPLQIFENIRKQKIERNRPFPSDKLITNGEFLNPEDRKKVIDISAALVDQAYGGRSDMCIYFACLVRYALNLLGHEADVCIGDAKYSNNEVKFTWEHSWVEFEEYIIDGNVDTMIENPAVPMRLDPKPYWGKAANMPTDRIFAINKKVSESEETEILDSAYIEWKHRLKHFLESQKMI